MNLELRTPQSPATHVKEETGHRARAGDHITTTRLLRRDPLTTCDLVSHVSHSARLPSKVTEPLHRAQLRRPARQHRPARGPRARTLPHRPILAPPPGTKPAPQAATTPAAAHHALPQSPRSRHNRAIGAPTNNRVFAGRVLLDGMT